MRPSVKGRSRGKLLLLDWSGSCHLGRESGANGDEARKESCKLSSNFSASFSSPAQSADVVDGSERLSGWTPARSGGRDYFCQIEPFTRSFKSTEQTTGFTLNSIVSSTALSYQRTAVTASQHTTEKCPLMSNRLRLQKVSARGAIRSIERELRAFDLSAPRELNKCGSYFIV